MAYLRSETASYLASSGGELAKLAEDAGFNVLGHLFRMAELEAKNIQRQGLILETNMPDDGQDDHPRVGAFAT